MEREIKKIKYLLQMFSDEELDELFEETKKPIQAKIDRCPRCKVCGGFAKWKTENEYYDYCYGEKCEGLGYNNGQFKGPRVKMSNRKRFIIKSRHSDYFVKDFVIKNDRIDTVTYTSNPKESRTWNRKVEPMLFIDKFNKEKFVVTNIWLILCTYSAKTGVEVVEIPTLPRW